MLQKDFFWIFGIPLVTLIKEYCPNKPEDTTTKLSHYDLLQKDIWGYLGILWDMYIIFMDIWESS